MNQLYKLKLHETVSVPDGLAIRVPGGWIYTITTQVYSGVDQQYGYSIYDNFMSSVFVPYNQEFEWAD